MAVRAAGWAFLGMLLAGTALAADRPAAPPQAESPQAETSQAETPQTETPQAEAPPIATGFRIGGDDADTRFVMDLSRRIELRAFTLADPYRVVLDIPEVSFELPSKAGDSGRGLIKQFRFGLIMPGGSRMVFDVAKPVRIDKAFVVDAADGAPARLVLDLAPTDRDSFLRKSALDNKPSREQPPVRTEPTAKSGDPRPLVMLDPGHGGIDTGTVAPSGEMEKTIVLAFAQRLRDEIEKAGKYRVQMTRSDDTFIPLADRVRIARNAGASLFVSIHADSLPHREGDAEGATVYTLSGGATDSAAERLAEKENRADVIAGVDLKDEPDDVAGILLDLAQRETKTFSLQFAHKLVGGLKAATRLHKEPIKSAGFRVLRAPDIPSVLVELGYVSNKQDLQSLLSERWRDRTAASVAGAIDSYFATHAAGAHADTN